MSDKSGMGQKRGPENEVDFENLRKKPKITVIKAPSTMIADEGGSADPTPALTPPDTQAMIVAQRNGAAAAPAAAAAATVAEEAPAAPAAVVAEAVVVPTAVVAAAAGGLMVLAAAAPAPAAEEAPAAPAPSTRWLDSGLGSHFNSVLFAAQPVGAVGVGGVGDVGGVVDAMGAGNAPGGGQGNDGSALRACNALDALRSAPPADVAELNAEQQQEQAAFKAQMLADQRQDLQGAVGLGALRNPHPDRLATARTQFTEEDAFVQRGVAGVLRKKAVKKATITKWRKQLRAEMRIVRKKKGGRWAPKATAKARRTPKATAKARRTPKATAKAEPEDEWEYMTGGSPEWSVRAREWRTAGYMSPQGMDTASRPGPAGSREQAAGGTAPPPESCRRAARSTAPHTESDARAAGWRPSPAGPHGHTDERQQGMKRDSRSAEKNAEYEAYLAEQRVIFALAGEEVREEVRQARKEWEGPRADAYEKLAAEIGEKGGSEADFLAGQKIIDDEFQEWEREEFVAAYGGRGSATVWPVIGETLDGGTAGAASDDLRGGAAAEAGGGATGMGAAAGGAQEDAASSNRQGQLNAGSPSRSSPSNAGSTDAESGNDSPVRAPQPPSAVARGKRKRQTEAYDFEQLEEPED